MTQAVKQDYSIVGSHEIQSFTKTMSQIAAEGQQRELAIIITKNYQYQCYKGCGRSFHKIMIVQLSAHES